MVTFVCDHGKCPQLVIYVRCKWYNMQLDSGFRINESVLKAHKHFLVLKFPLVSSAALPHRSKPTTGRLHRTATKKKKPTV